MPPEVSGPGSPLRADYLKPG